MTEERVQDKRVLPVQSIARQLMFPICKGFSMSLTFRSVLDAIPIYRPGGCPDEQGEASAIKLSSNESPWQPPQSVIDAVALSANQLNRYPDFYKEELAHKIATYYELNDEQVAIDNGSGTLLQDFVRIVADQGDEVIFGTPSFAAYEIDVLLAGAKPVKVPLNNVHTYDLEAMRKAITDRTRLIMICNPNNPTGTFVSTESIREFIKSIPDNILVVVDEAYHEFVTCENQNESLSLLDEFDNVALLRTFSKSFGLAGMRIGYALTTPDIVDAINKTIAEFSVSIPAQAAACACLEPDALSEINQHVDEITSNRAKLESALAEKGIEYIPSQSNFVMLLQDSMTGFNMLEKGGVICRPFNNPEGIRITIGTEENMKRVANAIGFTWPQQ